MSSNILWFTTIGSYIVQTKCFSRILSRQNSDSRLQGSTSTSPDHNEDHSAKILSNLAVHLAIIYFATWFLLIPLSRVWNISYKSSATIANITENDINGEISANSTVSNNNSNNNNNNNNMNLNRNTDSLMVDDEDSKFALFVSKFKHFCKMFTLSLLLLIVVIAYTVALSMTPAFDVTLIQNTSVFEITTLLYGVCNISKKQNVFRNFIIMMIALSGILIISYTNATCDLLAGKLSINKETGEVNDPFLFDRLKAALLCGLCSLTMGPFAVLSNKWLTKQRTNINKRNIMYIPTIAILLLLPVLPKDVHFVSAMNERDGNAWLMLFIGIVGGIIPNIISIILLNKRAPAEFLTTANLAVIVMTGMVQWISESDQIYIVRWEVIGYMMLSLSSIVLFFTLREVKERA